MKEEKLLKIDAVIEKKVMELLGKYKDEPDTKSEILSELSMYQINRYIALELHDDSSVNHLTKELMNKLNQF